MLNDYAQKSCWTLRGWSHRPIQTSSIGIFGCDSVKSGGLPSIAQRNPQQFHSWNQMEMLVWTRHESCPTLLRDFFKCHGLISCCKETYPYMWLVVELIPSMTLVYIKEKKCKNGHGTWGPQGAYFQAYTIHCHGPTSFVVGKAKEVLSLQMSRDHGREMPFP
jgi:hypothetical protein